MRMIPVALGLVGCPTPSTFDRAYDIAWCDQLFTCDPITAEGLFGTRHRCEGSLYADAEGIGACLATRCAFDGDAAADCLSGVRGATCLDFLHADPPKACAAVWRDCEPAADACRGGEP